MHSNDIIVSTVTNACQMGEKQRAGLKTKGRNAINWYKQSITSFFVFIKHLIISNPLLLLRLWDF